MANAISTYKGKKAPALANPIAATCFKQSDNSAMPSFVRIPIESGATDAYFRVRARGRATTGTTSNFKATLQFSSDITSTTAATAGSNTDFYALTNRSMATITRPWFIDVVCVWDSTSQRLSGEGNGFNSETIETANASITALTAVDLTTGKCGFVISALFGTTNASNSVTLDDFVLEVL